VTLKGQGRDPNVFGAHYLDNGYTDSVTNRAHIENGLRVSNGHVTLKGQGDGPDLDADISKSVRVQRVEYKLAVMVRRCLENKSTRVSGQLLHYGRRRCHLPVDIDDQPTRTV